MVMSNMHNLANSRYQRRNSFLGRYHR